MMNTSVPHVSGYEILEKIGVGSFAVVYKALTKTTPKEVVAIKCMDMRFQKKTFADNVIKEILLLKVLKHDYIVRLIDFKWDVKHIFIVTEYCDEGDLSIFIRKRHKLSEVLVKVFMQQLALALKFLHGYNICHMDLKPQNLLLQSKPTWRLKVADFGLSQVICSNSIEEHRFDGSVLYMAPEKLLNLQFDARVDLWSVGIIMYECLFGRPPFINMNTKKILEVMNRKQPILFPSYINISQPCENLLQSLLKYQQEERITFDEYFQHEFLDLEHIISADSYVLTLTLLNEAISLDESKQYAECLPKYEEASRNLEGFIALQTDPYNKALLQQRLKEYTARINRIKEMLNGKMPNHNTNPVMCPHYGENSSFKLLRDMCNTTPKLLNGLDIGYSGELYYAEGKKQLALEKLTIALSLLIPLLGVEPVSVRKDMLHSQIRKWLGLAESLKQQT